MTPAVFVKGREDAPDGFYAAEAAGLRWLADTGGSGVRVTQAVGEVTETSRQITLPRVAVRPTSPDAAEDFGRRLAHTHRSGADWFGQPPAGRSVDRTGFIGVLEMSYAEPGLRWGTFFADHRLQPYAERARREGTLSRRATDDLHRLCERLRRGERALCGPEEPASRVHGDLWSGNVLWDDRGAVLIDPAAHGGHRESDLAMLALFGLPHLDRVLASYHQTWPLTEGWRHRVALHQLFPVLVHTVLFGAGYGAQAEGIIASYS